MEKKIDPKKLKAVSFTWIDAATKGGWQEEGHGPAECYAVGYVVEETEDHITITATISDDGAYLSPISIPKAWVRKRKKVRI